MFAKSSSTVAFSVTITGIMTVLEESFFDWENNYCLVDVDEESLTSIAMIFCTKRLKDGVSMVLEPICPLKNYLLHVEVSNRFLLRRMITLWLTPFDGLEQKSWILRGCDTAVTMECLIAIVVVVITPLDATLDIADP